MTGGGLTGRLALRLGRLRRDDRGAGTVLVLAVVCLTAALAVAVAALGQVAVARARAQSAADLAALAGASLLREGASVDEACDLAAEVTTHNRATVGSCSAPAAPVLAVTAQVSTPAGPARASARAGPESAR